jgi:hypothetical protein
MINRWLDAKSEKTNKQINQVSRDRKAICIADNKASGLHVNGPERREAAGGAGNQRVDEIKRRPTAQSK